MEAEKQAKTVLGHTQIDILLFLKDWTIKRKQDEGCIADFYKEKVCTVMQKIAAWCDKLKLRSLEEMKKF